MIAARFKALILSLSKDREPSAQDDPRSCDELRMRINGLLHG